MLSVAGVFETDDGFEFIFEPEKSSAQLACFECGAVLDVPLCWDCGCLYFDIGLFKEKLDG